MVDESGDFSAPLIEGRADGRWYIVALVFHDQTEAEKFPDFEAFDVMRGAANEGMGIPADAPVHAGNLIRRESPYGGVDIPRRLSLFEAMVDFAAQCADHPVRAVAVSVDRSRHADPPRADGLRLADARGVRAELYERFVSLVNENRASLERYETVRIYYDNGQGELTRLLHRAFDHAFPDVETTVEFKGGVLQREYLLLQVADLCCALSLLALKTLHGRLGRSEVAFFGGVEHDRGEAMRRICDYGEALADLYDIGKGQPL